MVKRLISQRNGILRNSNWKRSLRLWSLRANLTSTWVKWLRRAIRNVLDVDLIKICNLIHFLLISWSILSSLWWQAFWYCLFSMLSRLWKSLTTYYKVDLDLLTSRVPTFGACSRAFKLIRHLVCTKSRYSFELVFFSSGLGSKCRL